MSKNREFEVHEADARVLPEGPQTRRIRTLTAHAALLATQVTKGEDPQWAATEIKKCCLGIEDALDELLKGGSRA